MKNLCSLVVCLALECLVLAVFPGTGMANAGGNSLRVGDVAPIFACRDIAGDRFDLSETVKKYRVVVLNFWGLRCQACLQEMPHLKAIHARHKDAGVAVFGINADGVGADVIKAQLDRLQITPGYIILPDEELKVADLFKMAAAPLTIVLDSTGTVRFIHEGYKEGDEKELEGAIKSLLQ